MSCAAVAAPAVVPMLLASPSPLLLVGIAVLGSVASGISFSLALDSEEVAGRLGEPLVVATLTVWLTLSYILCGVAAWWRRPASRFGPLMVAAGFANFCAILVWSSNAVLFTFGQSLDFLPPIVFLHVFLAFPDGRVKGRTARVLLVIAYPTAIALELSRMYFGGLGSSNLLEGRINLGLSAT